MAKQTQCLMESDCCKFLNTIITIIQLDYLKRFLVVENFRFTYLYSIRQQKIKVYQMQREWYKKKFATN